MLALTYPWIIGLLVIVALIHVVSKRFVIGGICFLVSLLLNWYCECFALHFVGSSDSGGGNIIRVLSWNVNADKDTPKQKLEAIANIIFDEDPDIVFVSELFWDTSDTLTCLLTERYPFTTDTKQDHDRGHFVYSKYHLSNPVFLLEDVWNGLVLSTRVFIGTDSLMLYGCHLASNNYDADRVYMTPDSIRSKQNVLSYIKNVRRSSEIRCQQSDAIVSELIEHNAPVVVLGDMNDVCGSPCMKVFAEAGLKDAWWEGGFGYGATIHKPLPYRIDHVMYGKGLKLKGIKKVSSKGLSDHDALVADFEIE